MNIELKDKVPAMYRTAEEGPSEKASDKYKFITTLTIVEDLAKFGWEVYNATQQKSWKNPETTKHMVRFRNKEYGIMGINGNVPEIILVNSHDTTTAFRFHVGLFRTVCSNGLIVAEETFNQLKLRHMGYKIEGLGELINTITSELPTVFTTVQNLDNKFLTEDEITKFAMEAYALRYPNHINDKTNKVNTVSVRKEMDIQQLTTVVRPEDKGNSAWKVLNVIQENLINGNYDRLGSDNKVKKARPISNIRMNLIVNSGLWKLATEHIK